MKKYQKHILLAVLAVAFVVDTFVLHITGGGAGLITLAIVPGISTNFAGDVVEELMMLAVTENEIVEGGHIYVDEDIQLKRSLPRVRQTNIIQDMAATPTSFGSITTDERQLIPDPFLVYIEFDPNEFRKLWAFAAPRGEFVYTELDPSIQAELLRMLLEGEGGVNNYMGSAILQGDKVSGVAPLNKFNGLIYRAVNDADVSAIAAPVALTGGSSGNIADKFQLIYDASRIPVRNDPDFKYLISVVDFEKWRSFLQAKTYKSIDETQDAPKFYHGKNLVPLVGMPENTIIATTSNPTRKSNIWLGVRGTIDQTTIKVAPVQNNSDLWFFKMKMNADTQIKFGQDLVLYKA